jgi:hypothetical protein
MANKKFTSIPNDFNLFFSKSADIVLVEDDGDIKRVSFEFTNISSIENTQAPKAIDVIGVVGQVGDKS